MARTRVKKRIMAEMNVVPYIDVMLVLLVIFMITAPLLTQGVKVELPKVSSQPIQPEEKEPLVVTVDKHGRYYINVGDKQEQSVQGEELLRRVAIILRRAPGTPVLVRGDTDTRYGQVVYAMTLLQQAGAPSVGLLTQEDTRSGQN